MSAINQMLRDLDKRNALGQGATPASAAPASAATPNRLASAYAAVRLAGPRTRPSRAVLMVAGAAALLPIAWATVHFDLPAMAVQAAPTHVATAAAMPVRVATAPMSAPVAAEPPPVARAAAVNPPVPLPEAPIVLATAPAAPLATARPMPVVAMGSPSSFATATLPSADPSTPKPRLVRAPAMTQANGEDALPAPSPAPSLARSSALSPAPASTQPSTPSSTPPSTPRAAAPAMRDTRVALASPTVPKDEARIERRPTDARDDLVRAGEAMSIGRTSDAIQLLRKVIQTEPDNERARLALLSLLAERGRDDTWRAMLADSAKVLPQRFGLAAAQGMAESGRFEESLAILRSLPESVRDTRYFSALGATHQQLNQHAEAVTAFDAALGATAGASPQLPSLLVAQALSMQSLGRSAQARGNLERVRQMPEAAAEVRDYAVRELAHSR